MRWPWQRKDDDLSHLTEQSRAFIEEVPDGGWYVLSREGRGLFTTQEQIDEARRLSDLNFARLRKMTGKDYW